MPTIRRVLRAVMPPALWNLGKDFNRRLFRSVDHISYEPAGWPSLTAGEENFWAACMPYERAQFQAVMARIQAGESPLATPSDEHLKYLTYGYVLGRVAAGLPSITVLDYGGNFGEYFGIGRALAPGIALEYHCKELPQIADVGRALNPEVTWHINDNCLDRDYDIVMFCSSLQYLPDWRNVLRRAAPSGRYLFLSDVPTVSKAPSFVANVRRGGMNHLQHVLNRDELMATMESTGLKLQEEIAMGPHPAVGEAPEQPVCSGWLFERSGLQRAQGAAAAATR